jgi:dihydroflavonol-4-reductase
VVIHVELNPAQIISFLFETTIVPIQSVHSVIVSSPTQKNKPTTMRALSIFLLACLLIVSRALSIEKVSRVSLVTGSNGYLGREIVHELLHNDVHPIVCLVRAGRVNDELLYWKDRANEGCIAVHPYDMLDGGASLADAFTAVAPAHEYVIYHVASVFGPTEDHRQTALDNVKGTEDLVHCLAKIPNTKLVLTSSMAAVRGTGQLPTNNECYSYLDWNTNSELGTNWGSSYQWSKAQSERRAWELTKEYNVPMVALCPSFIFGPSHDGSFDSNSFSIQLLRQWIRGESQVQSRLCVDVRDVAKAHVAAGTRTCAIGQRYIVSTERRLRSNVLADVLKEISATPEKVTWDDTFDGGAIKIGDREVIAIERLATDLGITLTPPEVTFRDMARAITGQ